MSRAGAEPKKTVKQENAEEVSKIMLLINANPAAGYPGRPAEEWELYELQLRICNILYDNGNELDGNMHVPARAAQPGQPLRDLRNAMTH